jgi:ferritin-like metal-binding protein YciE
LLGKAPIEKWQELAEGVGTKGAIPEKAETAVANGDLVDNTIDDLAATHKGIATYTSLAIAAGSMGDAETARICRLILQEENYAADLFRRQLPAVTHMVLNDGVFA